MKKLAFDPGWPDSWKRSHPYDQLEVWGDLSDVGYVYAYANRRAHTLALVDQVARPGAKILDVAAAQGNFTLALAERGYDVTWNDLRSELADYVRLKHTHGAVRYAPGNAFELGLEEAFDVVLITEVIEHVAHPDEFLRKAGQLVRPGGHVVMTTPNGAYLRNKLPKFSECPDTSVFEKVQFGPDADAHIFLLHLDELPSMAREAGLIMRETRLFTNPVTSGFLKTESLLRLVPSEAVQAVERFTQRLPMPLRSRLHTAMAVLFEKAPAGSRAHPRLSRSQAE